MNILIVTQYFYPESFRINDIAFNLAKRGHQVTVLTGTPNYPEGKFYKGFGWFKKTKENIEGVNVIRVPIIPRGKAGKIRLLLNYLSYAFAASIVGPFICHARFDVILAFQLSPATIGIPAVVMKKIKKAPLLFWVQDLWPESISAVGAAKSSSPFLKPIGSLIKFLYAKSDRILVQSKAFESSIKKYRQDIDTLDYLPNCAEKLYKPLSLNKETSEYKQMLKGFRVMFAGNIGVAQDFDTILKAASILKDQNDIKWIIIGDGRAKTWVEKRVHELNLSDVFQFLGKHPVEKMPRYFSNADVMLVTLKKEPIFALTIPAKIQSYLACAKPIVAGLDGEGARIIDESGAGISCNAEDPKALSEAVIKMYKKSSSQRDKMGLAGRDFFLNNFESDMLVSRLENWMYEVFLDQKN
jgi:colanic acid biosynthesis glycosyl transferase WcaI